MGKLAKVRRKWKVIDAYYQLYYLALCFSWLAFCIFCHDAQRCKFFLFPNSITALQFLEDHVFGNDGMFFQLGDVKVIFFIVISIRYR